MIIDFTVSNYLSIKDEITLSFLAYKKKDRSDLLVTPIENNKYYIYSFSSIYGPNASGKSNLIKALSDFKNIILFSHRLDLDSPIPSYKPFRLDKKTSLSSIKFEIEFIAEVTRYFYSVEFTETQIVKEELSFYPEGRIASLFKRNEKGNIKYGKYFKGEKKNIETFLLPNRLFLSLAANSQNDVLKPVYRFFMTNIDIHVRMDSSHTPFHSTTIELRDKKNEFEKLLFKFLKAADLSVKDVKLIEDKEIISKVKIPDEIPDEIRERIIDDLRFRPYIGHPIYLDGIETDELEYFDLENEESTGTIKMYDIAGEVIKALKNGTVLIIDEFNSGLHPILNKLLVELFINPEINKKKAQLLISTHDTCVLDMKRLRREQIWFTKKEKTGATNLYSLDEFDKNIIRDYSSYGKNYLEGRFNAVPALEISELVEELFNA